MAPERGEKCALPLWTGWPVGQVVGRNFGCAPCCLKGNVPALLLNTVEPSVPQVPLWHGFVHRISYRIVSCRISHRAGAGEAPPTTYLPFTKLTITRRSATERSHPYAFSTRFPH